MGSVEIDSIANLLLDHWKCISFLCVFRIWAVEWGGAGGSRTMENTLMSIRFRVLGMKWGVTSSPGIIENANVLICIFMITSVVATRLTKCTGIQCVYSARIDCPIGGRMSKVASGA